MNLVKWIKKTLTTSQINYQKSNAPLGKFCVLGEKDEANNDIVRSILNQSQFEILENETILLSNQKSDGITLSALSNTPDPSKITAADTQYNLLVTHMPDTLTNEELSTKSISLALCGHSHGTQITFPILGGYKTIDGAKSLNRSCAKKISSYIISSGVGCTHGNLRFMSTPEIYYSCYKVNKHKKGHMDLLK